MDLIIYPVNHHLAFVHIIIIIIISYDIVDSILSVD